MAEVVAAAAHATGAVEVIPRIAAEATLPDLLTADGYLFGTPETFGSMCGMLKDFFERTYYPAQDQLRGRPFALFVCAGNDGSGAVTSIQRIARGYGLREVQPALVVRSDDVEARLSECEELGTTMALGLAMGLF
jgi:multimeric flavodoxin WrbA